ncbi:L,D-transpeptidase [bacterium]|nr:L,D-transpeptidase [bacterium]MDB4657536.1 L,D-transpeptidase [Verrucomicrobiales bacterium]MDC0275781.1 L,D-transpeptidase [Verrucomicrobiales bacterium]MDC0322801.1 L,D-transpeptidase [Verrucomicrobiales bacterium]
MNRRTDASFFASRFPAALASLVISMTTNIAAETNFGRKITIYLNETDPEKSYGTLQIKGNPDVLKFVVGFGKKGVLKEGKTFTGNYSLLGEFRVNAILTSGTRFEMDPKLVSESGKTEAFLKSQLFKNMSSIDFDGDGKGGEYGAAFIGLEPLDTEAKQPFHFGEYAGTFRWYSYAIHGTQDESRIGKMVTGGCINVGAEALAALAKRVKLGDLVEVRLAE